MNSVSLWSPLIKHIQILHIGFAHTICARIVAILLPDPVAAPPASSDPNDEALSSNEIEHDLSYHMCLARWMVWLVDNGSAVGIDDEMDVLLRRDVIETLMQALGHRFTEPRPGEIVAYVQSFSNCVVCSSLSFTARRLFELSALKSHGIQLP